MTDFGIAKVLAGQYNLLATEIYQQIIGLHNFPMGAALSLLLLLPMLLAFIVDNWARKNKHVSLVFLIQPYRKNRCCAIAYLPCYAGCRHWSLLV